MAISFKSSQCKQTNNNNKKWTTTTKRNQIGMTKSINHKSIHLLSDLTTLGQWFHFYCVTSGFSFYGCSSHSRAVLFYLVHPARSLCLLLKYILRKAFTERLQPTMKTTILKPPSIWGISINPVPTAAPVGAQGVKWFLTFILNLKLHKILTFSNRWKQCRESCKAPGSL